jgi:hypothetical protein
MRRVGERRRPAARIVRLRRQPMAAWRLRRASARSLRLLQELLRALFLRVAGMPRYCSAT